MPRKTIDVARVMETPMRYGTATANPSCQFECKGE